MKVLVKLLILMSLPIFLQAQTLNTFQWKNRVVILFTPDPQNAVFEEQYRILNEVEEELVDRRLIVIMVEPTGNFENSGLFLDEAQAKRYYDIFNPEPYQFEMVLVGLDGNVKLRARNSTTPSAAIFELIDSMPMRQKEIRQRYGSTYNSNTKAGNNAVRY